MASDQGFTDYVVDQMSGAGNVAARKMFGEYGVYCDQRLVALVCDNQVFVKPTDAGGKFAGNVPERPPYPGAKPYYLITERLDDREWLTELIAITARELPLPKPRTDPKRKRR